MNRIKRWIAVCTSALLVATGLVVGGAALAANAHAGNIKATAVCNTATGQYDVTYTVSWTQAPQGGGKAHYRTGESGFINGWQYPGGKSWTDVPITSGSGSFSFGESLPGTTKTGPWAYTFIEWADNYQQQKVFDTRIENLDGKCSKPEVKDADASATVTSSGTCLAKGAVQFNIVNATWENTTDVTDGSRKATANAGHKFADGSTTKIVTYDANALKQIDYKDPACKPKFEVVTQCGYVKITYQNNSKWDRWPDYRVEGDGVVAKDAGSGPYYTAVKVPAGQTSVIFEKTFDEDYGDGLIDVTYQDILGGERDIDTAAQTVRVETDCVPPLPAPCTTTGDWFTESDDTAPIETIDGLKFQGGSGKAVGYGQAVTGNLQGLQDISYTASGDVDKFYVRIVIDSTADGGYAYDSLTIISEGPVTGDSIAASNKRGFEQHTLDEWAALLPNNALKFIFFHLDSGASADESVILSSVISEGCLAGLWNVDQPKPKTGTETLPGEPFCSADGPATVENWARYWSQGYVPNLDRTAWVLGQVIYGEPYLVSTTSVEGLTCVTAAPPTFEDVCGVAKDKVNLPDIEGISYSTGRSEDGLTVTVTATAEEGFILTEDTDTHWTFKFTNVACPGGGLAQTGMNDGTPLLIGIAGSGTLLGALLIAIAVMLRRRREEDKADALNESLNSI